jgi:hypothetical protein
MNRLDFKEPTLRAGKLCRQATVLLAWMALMLGANLGFGGESSLTKYQVEALFLLNFAKYVDWPVGAFTNAAAPITIDVLGTDPFGDDLQHTVEGKTLNGRPFVIKHLDSISGLSGCQILFISDSEASRMVDILGRVGTLPILTVGEDELFARNGGVIHFLLKNGNVRLEIDLAAAKKAGLTISSRLLAVADVVKGKTN